MSYVLDAGARRHGMDELSEQPSRPQADPVREVAGTGKAAISFDRGAIDARHRICRRGRRRHAAALAGAEAAPGRRGHGRASTRRWSGRWSPVLGADGSARHRDRPADPVAALRRFRAERWRGSRRRSTSWPASRFNIGSPKQLGDILFGKMGLPGGTKTATGAWSTGARVLEDLAEQGHELPRTHPRLAPALQAEIDLYRRAARLRQPADRPRAHLLLARRRRRPAGSPRPSRTCRTSRSAPRRAAASAPPSSRRRATSSISADYSQIELRVLAHIADIPQLKQAFADGIDIHAMTASEMFGVPVAGMPTRRAPARQGDQFRHHLRHLGLRARQPARHPARGGRRLYQASISSASPASATTWTRPSAFVPRATAIVTHDLRPQMPLSRRSTRRTRRSAPSSSAPRSTRRSRARPPTSSAAPWSRMERRAARGRAQGAHAAAGA